MASKILGNHVTGGPFGKPLPDYSVAELDFVLEMAARDDPERYSFTRNGVEIGKSVAPVSMARWTDVLMGAMLVRYMERIGVAAGRRNKERWLARRQGGLRPGITRGGKSIDAGSGDTGS